AFAGAACIASMFTSVLSGEPIDVGGAKNAGAKIAETIAENGLSDWLATVRRHHEGTYQHCLLVTGVTVDFGLSLGVTSADLVRILTISDIFAALIEFRTYKPVMPREKAYEIVQSMEGKLEKPLIGAFRAVALTR